MQRQPDAREDVYFVLTSLAHVVAAVLFGMLLNLTQLPGLFIITFAILSKSFALFIGENERFFTHLRVASIPLGFLSVAILGFLSPLDWILGGAIILLYLNYPLLLKAREKSPLDIVFHGGRYAMLFWLGYGAQVTPAAVAGLSIVFLSGVAGELLVGLRSTGTWKTTASKFGVTSTVRVVNILLFMILLLGSFIFSQVIDFPLMVGRVGLPVPLFVGFLVAVYISRPVTKGRSWLAPVSVRKRELIVLVVLALLIIGIPLTTRVELRQATPGPNYTAEVTMQTIVIGQHPWDGQWIIFNYQSPGNYYYTYVHADGYLEVSGYVNGTLVPHLAYVKTDISPFNSHMYEITVDRGIAQVSIDGRVYASVPVQTSGGEVRLSQSFPRPTFWVVRVTSFRVVQVS